MQHQFEQFTTAHALGVFPVGSLLDLLSEMGELSEEYLSDTDYGVSESSGHSVPFEHKLGDVVQSIACSRRQLS